jgi:hypothetical protein
LILQGTPLAAWEPWRVAQPGRRTSLKAGEKNFHMCAFPQYYFQDIPAQVMHEIVEGMQEAEPEPTYEEIDHWLNCNNSAATIEDWYDRVAEFKVSR